jgi:hypothetical protein
MTHKLFYKYSHSDYFSFDNNDRQTYHRHMNTYPILGRLGFGAHVGQPAFEETRINRPLGKGMAV